jgi:hypothetical protein
MSNTLLIIKYLEIIINREILSAVESTTTQSLRVTLTRQLAEVLLRGITGADYQPPEDQIESTGTLKHKYSLFRIKDDYI